VQFGELKLPAPSLAKPTVPPGGVAVPGELSLTVAVHVDGLPIVTLPGLQETIVEAERLLMVSVIRFETSWIIERALAAVS
jgi:hypothetical protein